MGINMTEADIRSIATTYGCKVGLWPGSYLGLLLFDRPRTISFRNPIIEKIEKRLHSMNHSISKGGVLPSSKPPYLAFPHITYHFTKCHLRWFQIEKFYTSFLWKDGTHNIKWDKVIKPHSQVGTMRLQSINLFWNNSRVSKWHEI